jgi:SCY1-like protein 1
LTVIGKLSDRVINGELLRFLARTANDEQPGIRTNTTICLGKIAKNLSPGVGSSISPHVHRTDCHIDKVKGAHSSIFALSA